MHSEESRFSSHEVIDGRKVQLPFHFTEVQLQTLFSPHFAIEQLQDSFFYSSVLDEPAKARFVILRNSK
jgi:hypothetical protein